MKRTVFGVGLAIGAFGATSIFATTLDNSLRPVVRPANAESSENVKVASVAQTIRPKVRTDGINSQVDETALLAASLSGFDGWVRGFKQRARAQSINNGTLNAAFTDVRFDEEVIRRDRNQSEFTKTIWQYLDTAVSDTRISNGKKALQENQSTLEAIERRYGVEKEVIVAVWGMESAYGRFKGSNDVVQSLATLAYEGRRGAFFEEQLIAALKILQNGDTTPRNMTGSWAGAMGHTQFIPTSYLAFAVDFTGDGRRDIWSDDPTDALASTAAYLKRSGWKKGQPWGVEVKLPRGFDYTLANRKTKKSPGQWARLGIKDMSGKAVPNHGEASILLPAGANGAAFMIFDNFRAIERYNAADAYVIAVGHLSDRINGGPPIQSSWPKDERALKFSERKELQNLLTNAGFSTQGVDGRIGPNTINAVRSYQRANGMIPDGYPSLTLLNRLR